MTSMRPDVAVIGAGIVGLATALKLVESGALVTVLDKESAVAAHQTGHNSGVLHTGIYYKPGSFKARLCVEGRRQMLEFCEEAGIPIHISGKVVVAVRTEELPALEELHSRATANGVEGVQRISPGQLQELEPEAAGLGALHVPTAGVVDFKRVAEAMRRKVEAQGGAILTASRVTGGSRRNGKWSLAIEGVPTMEAPRVVVCAGLQSDQVASRLGMAPGVRIVPFRGEYWHLTRPELVRSLIYPVPDPRFPFLGVHFTRGIDGKVEVGPNAVLAFAREGYSWGKIVPAELRQIVTTPGLGRLARRYWRTGAAEIVRSLLPRLLLKAAKELIPALRTGDLVRAGAGVRAQALGSDGRLIDDFAFATGDGALAVLNAPSPAATASLSIGEEIGKRLPN